MQLSPSGKYLATLAPIAGQRNIVVLETDNLENARAMTGLKTQDVAGFFWASDDVIVFTMQNDGQEDFGLYSVDLRTKRPRIKPLIEPEFKSTGLRFATVVATLPDDPDHILVQWNEKYAEFFGLYKVNVHGGRPELLTGKMTDVTNWFVDHNGEPRGALKIDGLNGEFL
jgi:hypothetical protein